MPSRRTAVLAALAATASAFVAPSLQAPKVAPRHALVEEGAFVPDMERRNIMNLILVFGGALPAVGGLAVPYVLFFIPRGGGGGGGGERPGSIERSSFSHSSER